MSARTCDCRPQHTDAEWPLGPSSGRQCGDTFSQFMADRTGGHVCACGRQRRRSRRALRIGGEMADRGISGWGDSATGERVLVIRTARPHWRIGLERPPWSKFITVSAALTKRARAECAHVKCKYRRACVRTYVVCRPDAVGIRNVLTRTHTHTRTRIMRFSSYLGDASHFPRRHRAADRPNLSACTDQQRSLRVSGSVQGDCDSRSRPMHTSVGFVSSFPWSLAAARSIGGWRTHSRIRHPVSNCRRCVGSNCAHAQRKQLPTNHHHHRQRLVALCVLYVQRGSNALAARSRT